MNSLSYVVVLVGTHLAINILDSKQGHCKDRSLSTYKKNVNWELLNATVNERCFSVSIRKLLWHTRVEMIKNTSGSCKDSVAANRERDIDSRPRLRNFGLIFKTSTSQLPAWQTPTVRLLRSSTHNSKRLVSVCLYHQLPAFDFESL